ncbi:MAG: hypothetical protein ACSHYB_14125 [Roseibacillus sp.]
MKLFSLLPNSLLLGFLTFGSPLHGELPTLGEPLFGVFAKAEEKTVEIVVNQKGELIISPILRNGSTAPYRKIPVLFGIEETLPNGKIHVRPILPETLESPQPATDKFKEAVITGKIARGVAFELTIQQKRGVITIGGKITDPGPLKVENLRFVASPQILNFYGAEKLRLQDDPKAFEELLEESYVTLKWTDGKRHKFGYIESLGEESSEVNGSGIAEVEAKLQILGNTINFTATKESSIKLRNFGAPYFHSGFFVDWTSQDNDAQLTIEVE